MKQIINTTGLFLLIAVPTFAGNMDSTKKDSCCTTAAVKANRDNAPAAISAAEFAQAAVELNAAAANADADITFAYAAHNADHAAVAKADALTDLQVCASSYNHLSEAAVRNADRSLTAAHQEKVAFEGTPVKAESLTKLLIATDKSTHQQFARQYGMEVASSK
ncbi:hypothetical protein [Dinghuibacter silviterrae]|uniref:Outer membrane protein n=1 Tax=Dinghuibacter silviterrae TaxID=1539049 RepID=A0A4R8DI73_9BACT|nr:hypothetical protein [Dinghuibacter silviterrae]TDW97257.1 hypothetical protein EDB95_5104 [Dinghuibacter silviterrae]